jgi:WD40 repeat protein
MLRKVIDHFRKRRRFYTVYAVIWLLLLLFMYIVLDVLVMEDPGAEPLPAPYLQQIAAYEIDNIDRVILHPENDWLTVSQRESTGITILDLGTGDAIHVLDTPSLAPMVLGVTDLAWSRDGAYLAISFDEVIDIWQFADDGPIHVASIDEMTGDVEIQRPSLAWMQGDTLVFATGFDQQRTVARLNDTFDGIAASNDLDGNIPISLRASPEGELVAVYTSD